MGNEKRSGKILTWRSNVLALLIILAPIAASSGNIPSHINPGNVTVSDSNLLAQQLSIINELFFYRSGIFISLNKGNIKDAKENFDEYLRLFRENDNILVQLDSDVYKELKESAGSLNLSTGDIDRLRALYEEGKAAYENNQTDKAIRIAISARKIIGNLSSLQQAQIMDAVARLPGVNITLYETGLSTFNNTVKEIKKRWRPVELTLFDDTVTKLSVTPEGGEFGDTMNITGNLTLPRNGSGVPDAAIAVKLDNETFAILTTDRKGKYNYTFKIPRGKPGNHTIQVDFVPYDEPLLSSAAESTFFIRPANTTLTVRAEPGRREFGDILSVSGRLIARNTKGVPDVNVVVSLDKRTLANVRTDENGSYKYDFAVPVIGKGSHAVGATFIPGAEPFLQTGNITFIEVMQTNTTLAISGPVFAYQQDYFKMTGKLWTVGGLRVPASNITVLLDSGEIGNAPVKNGEFSFSYLINKNVSLGNHTILVKFSGETLFLPSENSTSLEIKTTPVSYDNIIFPMLAILGILITIAYLRKEKVLMPQIEALASSIRARFGRSEKIEEPSIATEPVKEEIEQEEPPVPPAQVQQEEIFEHLDNLIRQRQYRESISISFRSAKDCICAVSGIKITSQQTPREFYDLVKKSALAFAHEFKEMTEVYELAMYSSNKMNEDMALKTVDLLKKIYKISKND